MIENRFSFPDLIETLYKILETATDDVIGLYETFWSLPEGETADPDLGYSKKYPFAAIHELNERLVRKGYVTILASNGGVFIPVQDRLVLIDPQNYQPFYIAEGPGYVLSATDKGAALRTRIARRWPHVLLSSSLKV
jgi:hypothetical protein